MNAPVTAGNIKDFTTKYTPLIREPKISDFLRIEYIFSVTLITPFTLKVFFGIFKPFCSLLKL